jgi:hypothetical protein
VNLCHFFDFCQPKNPLEKYTPPYGTARGDPILMEGTVFDLDIVKYEEAYQTENYFSDEFINDYKYPFRSLVFIPRQNVKHSLHFCLQFNYIFCHQRVTNRKSITTSLNGWKMMSTNVVFGLKFQKELKSKSNNRFILCRNHFSILPSFILSAQK